MHGQWQFSQNTVLKCKHLSTSPTGRSICFPPVKSNSLLFVWFVWVFFDKKLKLLILSRLLRHKSESTRLHILKGTSNSITQAQQWRWEIKTFAICERFHEYNWCEQFFHCPSPVTPRPHAHLLKTQNQN